MISVCRSLVTTPVSILLLFASRKLCTRKSKLFYLIQPFVLQINHIIGKIDWTSHWKTTSACDSTANSNVQIEKKKFKLWRRARGNHNHFGFQFRFHQMLKFTSLLPVFSTFGWSNSFLSIPLFLFAISVWFAELSKQIDIVSCSDIYLVAMLICFWLRFVSTSYPNVPWWPCGRSAQKPNASTSNFSICRQRISPCCHYIPTFYIHV